MPAVITHYLFGQALYEERMPAIGGSRDAADAFLLGNQGPDPLFYAVLRPSLRSCRHLGGLMHDEATPELLAALREAAEGLAEGERAVGRAYALGFLCHYVLDSAVHPLVFAQQFALCGAGEPGLTETDGSAVHAVIESEFDELTLFRLRGITIGDFHPAHEALRASDAVLGIVSRMYESVLRSVYGVAVPPGAFGLCVGGFRVGQRAFHSPGGRKRRALGCAERLVRPHSFLQAMCPRAVERDWSAFANHANEPWENPFTGELCTESFQGLFDAALGRAGGVLDAFDDPAFDLACARRLTGNLNFSGKPLAV